MNARNLAMIGMGAAAVVALSLYYHFSRPAAGPVAHVENEFEFTAQGTWQSVAPLFGALAERGWAGDRWNPIFLYPRPARDTPGEVFIINHGHLHATWVNTALDLVNGHIQYAYTIPGVQAVLIDISLQVVTATSTDVKVVYQRTALSPRFNQHVTEQGNRDRTSAKEWETAINAYLKHADAE
ncbi:MAG: hypothetical protein ABSD20_01955 [Terriglobales bacterium]|jgi:hypothetical protein